MKTILEVLTGLVNSTAAGTGMSNMGRNGSAYGKAAVVLAYACLVHEVAPVVLAVLNAAGLA